MPVPSIHAALPSGVAVDAAEATTVLSDPSFWALPLLFLLLAALVLLLGALAARGRAARAGQGLGRFGKPRDAWTWQYDFRADLLECPGLLLAIGATDRGPVRPSELLRRHAHREDRRRFRQLALQLAGGLQVVDFAIRVRTAVGDVRWLHWQGRLVCDAGGGEARSASGVCRDITMETTAEFRLRLAEQVMDAASDAVVVVDAAFRVLNVNRRFTDITGHAPGDVLGRPLAALCAGDERAFSNPQVREVLRSVGQWEGEQWTLRHDGRRVLARVRINRIHDARNASTHYVCLFADVTESRQAEEQLRFLSSHDPLTGLLNHAALQDRLGQVIDTARFMGTSAAVLFLELRNFKQVNDSLGHRIGDDVVRAVARRLTAANATGDIVARHGGADFVIVLAQVSGRAAAAEAAARLLDTFNTDLRVNGMDIAVSPAIGISLFPGDGINAEQLISHADLAMTRARRESGKSYAFYESAMSAAARGELRRENQLRHALEERQFDLHYQPIIDVESGQASGLEALLRWHNPDFGLLMPGEFIHLAEDRGLISAIGQWVLQQACRDVSRLNQRSGRNLHVGVNVSAPQLLEPGFVERVCAALQESGMAPDLLRLELTESVIMEGTRQVQRVLNELKELGVHLALDDFGTGYSSLSYLRRFPITQLKIDKSFVRDVPADVNASSIVTTIIALGRAMSMGVIAEGVETPAQSAFLERHGCTEQQGFHFARPQSLESVSQLLRAGRLAPAVSST